MDSFYSSKSLYDRIFVFLAILVVSITYITSLDDPFFWDTIQLGSKHGHYFYEHGLTPFTLPVELDSGHIPVFGAYLSIIWKILGRNLLVTHVAMLPFVVGIVVFLSRLLQHLQVKYLGFSLLICLCQPTLLAQIGLISPDVVLMFLFLSSVYYILDKKLILSSISILLLTSISNRGAIVVFGLLIWFLLLSYFYYKEISKKQPTNVCQYSKVLLKTIVLLFLPSVTLIAWYSIYHYRMTGWIGFHSQSPWASSFGSSTLKEMATHLGIMIWRYLDFGMFLPILTLLYLTYKSKFNPSRRKILILTITIGFSLAMPAIFLNHLLAHRYFLPVLLTFLISYSLYVDDVKKMFFGCFIIVFLWIGNLWIYPTNIAQGWDASLAYRPYFPLRSDALNFIDENHIEWSEFGSSFPNLGPEYFRDLSENRDSFSELDLSKNQYVMFSNVYNDISDQDYQYLQSNAKVIWYKESGGVFIVIYKL